MIQNNRLVKYYDTIIKINLEMLNIKNMLFFFQKL